PWGPEVLVADHPGAADLRIHLQAEALPEGAVAVDAYARRQEILVADVEDVLEEESGGPDLLSLLVPGRERSRPHRGLRSAGEVLSPRLDLAHLVPDRLAAPREIRANGVGQSEAE